MAAKRRRLKFKTKYSFNEKLYGHIWEHIFGGPLATYSPIDILRHYGAAIRSFEENLGDDPRETPQVARRMRAEFFKAERILNKAATQLKRLRIRL